MPTTQIITFAALSSHFVMDSVRTVEAVKAWNIGVTPFAKAVKIVKAIIAFIKFVAKSSAIPERGK